MSKQTPVHKKDDPTEIGNYRPLSLLSVPSKILELCVADSIVSHVFNEELVTDNQWAYRKGRSTELLLAHLNKNCAFYLWTSKRRFVAFHTTFFSASCNTTLEFRVIYWHGLKIILRNGSNILLSMACLPRVLQLLKASHRALYSGQYYLPSTLETYKRQSINAASTYMYADDTTIYCVGETVDKVTAMMNRSLGELTNSV